MRPVDAPRVEHLIARGETGHFGADLKHGARSRCLKPSTLEPVRGRIGAQLHIHRVRRCCLDLSRSCRPSSGISISRSMTHRPGSVAGRFFSYPIAAVVVSTIVPDRPWSPSSALSRLWDPIWKHEPDARRVRAERRICGDVSLSGHARSARE